MTIPNPKHVDFSKIWEEMKRQSAGKPTTMGAAIVTDGVDNCRSKAVAARIKELTPKDVGVGYNIGESEVNMDYENGKHTVTCHCCGGLADERETTRLTDESGDICPECSEAVDVEIDKAWNNLKGYTSEINDRDIITELACRLVEAYREIEEANRSIQRLHGM